MMERPQEEDMEVRPPHSTRVRHCDLPLLELMKKRQYERLRKRAQREKMKAARAIGDGSERILIKPKLNILEGLPVGDSHNTLIRELSLIVKLEVLSFTSILDISDETQGKIYRKLHEKYEDGHLLSSKWTKRNACSLIGYRRTRTRRVVQLYLEQLPPSTGDPTPPPGVFLAEFEHFAKEPADDEFAKTRDRFKSMSTAMVEKRGCGNPMGRGGVARAMALHV